jgi:hypothetical protein
VPISLAAIRESVDTYLPKLAMCSGDGSYLRKRHQETMTSQVNWSLYYAIVSCQLFLQQLYSMTVTCWVLPLANKIKHTGEPQPVLWDCSTITVKYVSGFGPRLLAHHGFIHSPLGRRRLRRRRPFLGATAMSGSRASERLSYVIMYSTVENQKSK